MDQETIIRICEGHFETNAIVDAKHIIFEYNRDDSLRNINRKGDKKNENNIRDIIDVIRKNDPRVFPRFVAKDMNNVPLVDARVSNGTDKNPYRFSVRLTESLSVIGSVFGCLSVGQKYSSHQI